MKTRKVIITVEAEIDIEMDDWAANPTAKDIDDVNACGYNVENSDDIYKHAALAVLRGHENCNLDVYGWLREDIKKKNVENPESCTFFDLRDISVLDCEVRDLGAAQDES